MVIGISSPITIAEFIPYLNKESQQRAASIKGLLAPSVDTLAKQYLCMGHDVVIFTLDMSVQTPILLEGEHLKIYIGEYRSQARPRGLTFFYSEVKALKSFVQKENGRLDVMHAHWTYEFALGSLAAKCPIFCTARDIAEEIYKLMHDGYRFIRLLMNSYVMHKKRINFIANSPYTRDCLLKYHPRLNIVAVIPNPCGLPVINSLRKVNNNAHIMLVSISNSNGPRKNINRLIKAFKQVKHKFPNAELHLVGGCFNSSDSYARIDGIIPRGAIAHAELPALFEQATLMIHPSLEESFGNTLVEAMAQGLPVIGGMESGAVPYVLDYGKAGALCDVSNPQELAKTIIYLLGNNAKREEIAQAGLNRVRTVFSPEAVANQTIELYKTLRDEKPRWD